MESDHLQEGLSLVTQAVLLDKDGKAKEAIEMYEKGIVQLDKAIETDNDSQRRAVLSQKVTEYRTRMEALKDSVLKRDQAEQTARRSSLISQWRSTMAESQTQNSLSQSANTAPPQMRSSQVFNSSSSNLGSSSSSNLNTSSSVYSSAYINQSGPGLYPAVMQQPNAFGNSYSSFNYQATSQVPTAKPVMEAPPPQAAYIVNPEAMSKAEAFQTGMELCQKGKELDDAKRYSEALQLYKKGLDYFLKAMKDEFSVDMKKKIGDKMRPYMDRAEALTAVVGSTANDVQMQLDSTVVQVPCCAFCGLALGPTETYKLYQNKPYHSQCVDKAAALVREEVKHFLTSKGSLKLRATLPKRAFHAGEQVQVLIHVNNESNKKINCIAMYILKTETTMQILNTSHGIERKPKVKETKEGAKDYANQQFPLEYGIVDLTVAFQIPFDLEPSENNGTFSRDYDIIVKCELPMPHGYLKTSFPVTILR